MILEALTGKLRKGAVTYRLNRSGLVDKRKAEFGPHGRKDVQDPWVCQGMVRQRGL